MSFVCAGKRACGINDMCRLGGHFGVSDQFHGEAPANVDTVPPVFQPFAALPNSVKTRRAVYPLTLMTITDQPYGEVLVTLRSF